MFEVELELEQFRWEGKLKLEDLTLSANQLYCQSEDEKECFYSINCILDLISFYGERDITIINNNQSFTRKPLNSKKTGLKYNQQDLEVFLCEAYLRYRDESFKNQTGVDGVLRYYLSAVEIPLLQARFLSFFSALELMLAHVTPPAAEGPLAGLIHAVRNISSIPTRTRDIAAARLAAPSLAERMIEFVRLTGIKGVTFQASYEERYRFDELLRLKEEYTKKGYSPRYGFDDSNLERYCMQLKDLIRESLFILLTQL